jgi:hypothetical protein
LRGLEKGYGILLPEHTPTTEKIVASIKGLRDHLQAGEEPIINIPAIWDDAQEQRTTPCDVILTNQRLLGYFYTTFPRPRLFLKALALKHITTATLRQKKYDPLFSELLVSDGERRIYIRSQQRKIEALYEALRAAIEQYAPGARSLQDTELPTLQRSTPVYGRQELHTPFERSPLAITLLFVGGISIEIVGALLWSATGSAQVGLPLCIAGFASVITAILVRRQRRTRA